MEPGIYGSYPGYRISGVFMTVPSMAMPEFVDVSWLGRLLSPVGKI